MKALIFQPHNDDAVIAIGGVLQKLRNSGWELTYVYITDGRHGASDIPPDELVKIREREGAQERELLKIRNYHTLGIEDQSLAVLDGAHRFALKQKMHEIFNMVQPDITFVSSSGDLHEDHRASHQLVVDVIQEGAFSTVVAEYQVWLFPDFYGKVAAPSAQVLATGIDRELKAKLRAIRCHRTQINQRRYDQLARHFDAYLAYLLNAPRKIGANYVEMIGLNRLGSGPEIIFSLMNALSPTMDVTEIIHGRKA